MSKIQTIFGATPSVTIARVHARWRKLVTHTYYRALFGSIGEGSIIYEGSLILNSEYMLLGNRVLIRHGGRLEVVLHGQSWRPLLKVGNDVNIEQHVHIVCHDQIEIEDNVSIAAQCAIVDTSHPPEAAQQDKKIGSAIDPERSSVFIGRNSFIGLGTTILPNVRIGRNCVIGAGSVVSRSIPDGSIAAGVPARVVRQLNVVSPKMLDSLSL